MEWKFDICKTFNCTAADCIAKTRKDCGGRFWETPCLYHGDHLNLNENKSEFVRMRMAEILYRHEADVIRIHKPLGK